MCKADREFFGGASVCILKKCGDGTLDSGEECDDGNRLSGDGCAFNCSKEICTNENEERRRVANKSEVCVIKTCNDGVLDSGE